MPRQRRILIVNKDDSLLDKWKIELGDKFHVTNALCISDAEEILAESHEFAAIVVESFEDGDTLHAISFIEKLRLKYRKPIIGIAAKHQQQQLMILAGCNVYSTKYTVPDRICEALKICDSFPKPKSSHKLKKSWRKKNKKEPDPAI